MSFTTFNPICLSATLKLTGHSADQLFTGTDFNLYYDIRPPLWHKRPNWFLDLGMSRLYDGTDLRLSYVMWREGISPFVVVELLSPGTEDEDLGRAQRQSGQPPTKWEVYEQILRVPYYVLFDRYGDRLRAFVLESGHYRELSLPDSNVWMPELNASLGLWHGTYEGITRLWLRWYSADQQWLPTDAEVAQQQAEAAQRQLQIEQERAERAEAELAALRKKLQDRGISLDENVM